MKLLFVGCCCLLLVGCCWLVVVCCLLVVVCCWLLLLLLFVVCCCCCCLMVVVACWLLLFVVCWLLLFVGSWLLVVGCCLFVVVCLKSQQHAFIFMHSFCHYIIPLFVVNSFVCYIEPLGSDGNNIDSDSDSASVSQGWICSDNFTCCHTEIEVANLTLYLTQSQYSDTGRPVPALTLGRQGWRSGERKRSTVHPPRLGTMCFLPDKHWHCFEGNLGETAERRGGARMGFSERYDATLS